MGMQSWLEPRKEKRKPISAKEWKTTKAMVGNKCVICGKTDKQVGGLEKAHVRAHARGGSQVIPMCAICHKKYDSGLLTATQLRKIDLTPQEYKRLIPPKKKKEKKSSLWL